MSKTSNSERLQRVGATAWRSVVLLGSMLLVAGVFAGLAYLVYRGDISQGPLVLLSGVIIGYVLRLIQEYV